jgi:hypothetical protein
MLSILSFSQAIKERALIKRGSLTSPIQSNPIQSNHARVLVATATFESRPAMLEKLYGQAV